MLLIQLFNFLKGYIIIEISGMFTERFLNICTRRGIHIWNVARADKWKLRANISIPGFRLLRPIAKKSRCRVRVLTRGGLPFFLFKHRNRKAFAAGIVVFAFLLYYMSTFIWMIDISGAKQLTLQQIADSLAESGVKIGMKRNKIDRDEAQRVMMTKLPEIGWIGINVKGSTVIVDVKERTVLPPAFDRDSPRSFIAASDGVITEINVTDGVQSVKIGDVVRKGQMLISGQVESETTPTRFVRADGVVFARVWHEETVDLPLYEEIKTATGKNKSKHTLKIFDFYVKLYISDKVRFENYDRTSYVKSFFLGNHNILPLTFHYDHYAEQSVERRALTGEAAIALVKKRMDEQYELPEIVRRDVQIADGKVKAVYECIENIAKETAVNVEEEVHDDGENP